MGQPYNWSVKYTRLNPEIVSTDSAIIKLYNPLPENITVNQNIGLSAQLMRSYVEKIILFRNLGVDQTPFFSDPNFNIDLGEGKGSSGEFETWNSLLDAGTTTQQKIIDKFFSGSLGNIKLNTDHSNFKNFINFSSAEERVENFYYKLQQIEAFDRRIGVLNNVTGSDALTNISSSTRRRNELIELLMTLSIGYTTTMIQNYIVTIHLLTLQLIHILNQVEILMCYSIVHQVKEETVRTSTLASLCI